MNILLLGDIFGSPGRKALIDNLPSLIRDKKLDWDDPKAVVRYIKVNRNGWNVD